MTTELVSVIIPSYNAENTIQRAIDSVLVQDYPAVELIVIDDGSSDQTVQLIWQMRQRCNDKQVKLNLIAQRNAGVSAARNRGVKEAKGYYIAFLDADDRWLPNKLSLHIKHLQTSDELGLSFARVNFVSLDGRIRKQSKLLQQHLQAKDFLSANPTISPSNWVVKAAVCRTINGFNTEMTHAEDQEFLIRVLQETDYAIAGIDQVLIDYTTSIDGLSANIEAMYQGWLYLMNVLQQHSHDLDYSRHHAKYCLFLAKRSTQVAAAKLQGWKYLSKGIYANTAVALSQPLQLAAIFLSLLKRSFSLELESEFRRTQSSANRNTSAKINRKQEVENA